MPILFITDSTGKLKTLEAALHKLLALPFRMAVMNEKSLKRLQEAVTGCQEIILATDDDHEGAMAARNGWLVLKDMGSFTFTRMRLNALSTDAIASAWQNRELFDSGCAIPGDTRAMLDRCIGETLSDFDKRIQVGRIQTALLSAISQSQLQIGEVNLTLSAMDGKRPYSVAVPVESGEEAQSLLELAAKFPACETMMSDVMQSARPWSYGEAVLRIAEALNVPLQRAADLLIALYESGRLSYPYSSAHVISKGAVAVVKKLAEQNRVRFTINRVTVSDAAHTSPAPLASQIDIASQFTLLPEMDQALSIISRNLVASGYAVLLNKPNTSRLPARAQKLSWQRVQNPLPWMRQPNSGFRKFTLQAILLRLMIQHQLGRPHTQVQQAARFASKSLLNSNLKLNAEGEKWLLYAPAALRDFKIARFLEAAIDCLPGCATTRTDAIMQAIQADDDGKIKALIERVSKKDRLHGLVGCLSPIEQRCAAHSLSITVKRFGWGWRQPMLAPIEKTGN